MEKITLSIFVPCFNEERNITKALDYIKEALQDISYEILVVDDASKDKTVEMVEQFKKNNSDIKIKIFRNEINKGIGFNYYETAYKASGKYYMLINGDAVEPPTEIKKIASNIGKADMVITYINDKRGIFRKCISKIFVFIINLITLNNLKYYNGPNIHLLENVKLYRGKETRFGFQAELIIAQLRHKKTYVEIEMNPYLRSSGSSKSLTPRSILAVILSLTLIFLNQIIYFVRKILKTN